jgi:SSS family solute:Na+ symporter
MDIYKEYIRPDAGNKELVHVGRIVAFVALLIATLIAPRFASFDQVYPLIQEYTGFIYPGIFLIFFMGMFWRHATANAALWTAIFTLPVAFAMKFLISDMPFIIRIGYVFIVLSILFVGLSLRERKHRVEASELSEDIKKKDVRFGSMMISISVLIGTVAAFFLKQFSLFALDSVYVLVAGFILLGIVLITNAKRSDMDEKALIFDRKIFKTSIPFNMIAIGICGILVFLYFYFW